MAADIAVSDPEPQAYRDIRAANDRYAESFDKGDLALRRPAASPS